MCKSISLFHSKEGVYVGDRLQNADKNCLKVKATGSVNFCSVDMDRRNLGVQNHKEAVKNMVEERFIGSLFADNIQNILGDLLDINIFQNAGIGQEGFQLVGANGIEDCLKLFGRVPRENLVVSACRSNDIVEINKLEQSVVADDLDDLVDDGFHRKVIDKSCISADGIDHSFFRNVSLINKGVISAECRDDLVDDGISVKIFEQFVYSERIENCACVVLENGQAEIFVKHGGELTGISDEIDQLGVDRSVGVDDVEDCFRTDCRNKLCEVDVCPIIIKRKSRILIDRCRDDLTTFCAFVQDRTDDIRIVEIIDGNETVLDQRGNRNVRIFLENLCGGNVFSVDNIADGNVRTVGCINIIGS